MSISLHSGAAMQQCNVCTSLTYAYDSGSSANKVLVVAGNQDNAQISGITYAALALTQKINRSDSAGVTDLWVRDDPVSGSNNVVFTCGVGGTYINFVVFSYDDADTSQNGSSATSAGATSSSVNVTTTSDNSYVVSFVDVLTTGGLTVGGSATEIVSNFSGLSGGQRFGVSHIQKVTAGVQNMSWSWDGSHAYDFVGLEITEATSPVVTATYPGWMGKNGWW